MKEIKRKEENKKTVKQQKERKIEKMTDRKKYNKKK